MQTKISPEIANLIRVDALSGKYTLIQLRERYGISSSTAYRILTKHKRHGELSGERIKVNHIILDKQRQAARFMYRYLGLSATEIEQYMGKAHGWFYRQAGTKGTLTSSPSVPIQIIGELHDIDDNIHPAGFYYARFYDEQHVWIVPIKRKGIAVRGALIPVKELARKCEPMMGRHYE